MRSFAKPEVLTMVNEERLDVSWRNVTKVGLASSIHCRQVRSRVKSLGSDE
jgi:hypothetical protein